MSRSLSSSSNATRSPRVIVTAESSEGRGAAQQLQHACAELCQRLLRGMGGQRVSIPEVPDESPVGQFLGQFGYQNLRYQSRIHTGNSGTNPQTMRENPVIRVPPRTTLNQ